MRYGSLCSGIGGLDLAVEAHWPNATPAWFCEFDPHAARVLARHWRGVPILPDIKTQDWSTVERVELVTAGYPCQPFSHAGKRQGAADPRHLWPYVIDAVRVLRPRLVVLENVAGHLGLGFDCVLGDLAEAGFDAEWCVVPASAAGACHRRERLFVVAHARSERLWQHTRESSTEETWPHEDHQLGGDGARQLAPYANSGRLQERSEPHPGPGEPRVEASRRADAHGCDAALADSAGSRRPWRQDADAARADARAMGCGVLELERGHSAHVPHADIAGLEGREPTGRHVLPSWGDYGPAIQRWEHVIGRPAPPPVDERGRLSVTFVEWMQGFDVGWANGLTRTNALRCLGNAVVQQQGVLALSMLTEGCDIGGGPGNG